MDFLAGGKEKYRRLAEEHLRKKEEIMTIEEIRLQINLSKNFAFNKELKDNDGNVIREFYFSNREEFAYVKTDSKDESIIHYDYFTQDFSESDLKDPSMPWAKYVFCYGVSYCEQPTDDPDEEIIYISPYIYWRDERCLHDSVICSRFLPKDINACCEGTYQLYPAKRPIADAVNDLVNSGFFFEDEDFADFIECEYKGLTPQI